MGKRTEASACGCADGCQVPTRNVESHVILAWCNETSISSRASSFPRHLFVSFVLGIFLGCLQHQVPFLPLPPTAPPLSRVFPPVQRVIAACA